MRIQWGYQGGGKGDKIGLHKGCIRVGDLVKRLKNNVVRSFQVFTSQILLGLRSPFYLSVIADDPYISHLE